MKIKIYSNLFLCLLMLLISINTAFSQHENHSECGTPPLTEEQRDYILNVIQKRSIARNSGTTCVPIKAHIMRKDDGTGGITIQNLNIGLSYLNYVYKAANIEFYWSGIDYASNTDYYDFGTASPDSDTEANLKAFFTTATNAINVYYVNTINVEINGMPFAAAGYAYYPWNSPNSNVSLMTNSATTAYYNGTFAHELGHYFSLPHTHDGTENGNAHINAENVPRSGAQSNCSTKGDLICDTQADPKGSVSYPACTYAAGATDINGFVYTPPINNIMSYYTDLCGGIFTPQQYIQIQQGLATRLAHTTYSLNAPPMITDAVTGLTVTLPACSGAGVSLLWTNVGANMGYLIERSTTSASTGFVQIAGGATAADVITYSDMNIGSSTTYYYRVKPANGNCNTYSNVVSVTSGYSSPTYSNVCYINGGVGIYMTGFNLRTATNVNLINNLSNGCSASLSCYLSSPPSVTAGVTYNLTSYIDNSGGAHFPQKVYIWMDVNKDGDFDDANEKLAGPIVISGAVSATGSITVPLSATGGITRLRIRSQLNTSTTVLTATNTDTYGEAEDYTLDVTAVLPVRLIAFKVKNIDNKEVKLDWSTASESNNQGFTVQYSSDGITFFDIANIRGKGNSTERQDYDYVHQTPIKGNNFYRLKQIDFDGKEDFSKIEVIYMDSKTSNAVVYPNPLLGNTFFVQLGEEISEETSIRFFDINGRLIAISYENQNEQLLKVNANNGLSTGIYFVEVKTAKKVELIKLMVK
jgi:hypothetical protein